MIIYNLLIEIVEALLNVYHFISHWPNIEKK